MRLPWFGRDAELEEEDPDDLREHEITQRAIDLLTRSRMEGYEGVINGWFTTDTWREAARRARVVQEAGVEVLTAREFMEAYERYNGGENGGGG